MAERENREKTDSRRNIFFIGTPLNPEYVKQEIRASTPFLPVAAAAMAPAVSAASIASLLWTSMVMAAIIMLVVVIVMVIVMPVVVIIFVAKPDAIIKTGPIPNFDIDVGILVIVVIILRLTSRHRS